MLVILNRHLICEVVYHTLFLCKMKNIHLIIFIIICISSCTTNKQISKKIQKEKFPISWRIETTLLPKYYSPIPEDSSVFFIKRIIAQYKYLKQINLINIRSQFFNNCSVNFSELKSNSDTIIYYEYEFWNVFHFGIIGSKSCYYSFDRINDSLINESDNQELIEIINEDIEYVYPRDNSKDYKINDSSGFGGGVTIFIIYRKKNGIIKVEKIFSTAIIR